MSGSGGGGYPFPAYRTNRNSSAPQCPLPAEIDSIQDYHTARYVASQCARAAERKATLTNDQQWLQYTSFFDCFANEDKARAVYLPRAAGSQNPVIMPGGKAYLDYEGGAKILLNASENSPQWLAARQLLREQVTRFHLGMPAVQQNPQQPTIQCVRDPATQSITCRYKDY
jgi:hypothetical protein